MENKLLKKEKLILYMMIAALFLGALAGAMYMAGSAENSELYSYLTRFFEGFSAGENRFEIFKNSLSDNLKIFLILTICGFFKIGIAGAFACCGVKGFVSGFTTAAFIRYYGAKGLFVPMASFLSTVVFIPVFIVFCTYSACFSLKREKKTKNSVAFFLLFALICFTVFCVVSFFDGYVTTTFMKLLRPFVVKF